MTGQQSNTEEPKVRLLGGFYFGEPVTDPYGQGWHVFDVSLDGNVFVTYGRATDVFLPCELTRVPAATAPATEEPAAPRPNATEDTAVSTTTARRITVKARTAGMWEAISRGVTYPVVRDSLGYWAIYDAEGIGFAMAGWSDAPDAARVRAAVREDLERLERGELPLDRELTAAAEGQDEAAEETLAVEDVAAELDNDGDEFDADAWREQYLADTTAPGLHWTERHLETVEHAAAAAGIVAEAGAYRRHVGGRRIAADLVKGLTGAGFLAAAEDGMVRATADGVEAARRIRMVPSALMTADDFTARARRVMRAHQSLSTTAQRERVLPCLPGGDEHRRRQQAARDWHPTRPVALAA
ncbi:hypothetical protein ACWF95_34050 [Streptomyces vinaceus]